jgi:hypothetical protein
MSKSTENETAKGRKTVEEKERVKVMGEKFEE